MIDTSTAQVSYKEGKLTFQDGDAVLVLNLSGTSSDLAESSDLMKDENFIGSTTLDDITPINYEQGDYQTGYGAARDTLSSNTTIAFAIV